MKATRDRGPCVIEGCEKRIFSREWCQAHYTKWLRHGDPLYQPHLPERERFWSKVTGGEVDSCWTWMGHKTPPGYGLFWRSPAGGGRGGRGVPAHRYAYQDLIGEIPEGLELDHLCRNPSCVNPWHLDPVTGWVNWSRSQSPTRLNALKTHCPRGHAYDDVNTRVYRGYRYCRACQRRTDRERREKAGLR